MQFPGDTMVSDPVMQATEAVYVDAPASVVWSWLMQMGRERGELYGVEGLRVSTDHDPNRQRHDLRVGDVIHLASEGWMGLPDGVTTLSVAEIVPERYVVLNAVRSEQRWNAVLSFHLQPHWEDRVRLLARVRFALRHPGEVFAMELARPLIALGTRALLLSVKHGAERPAQTGRMRSGSSVEIN